MRTGISRSILFSGVYAHCSLFDKPYPLQVPYTNGFSEESYNNIQLEWRGSDYFYNLEADVIHPGGDGDTIY